MEPKDLAAIERKGAEIVEAGSDELLAGFFSIDGAQNAIASSEFDIEEEMRSLIAHIRDPDPKVSLSGHRQFRSVLNDLVKANGMMGQASQERLTEQEDGTVLREKLTTSRFLQRIRSDNERDPDSGKHYEFHAAEELPAVGSTRNTGNGSPQGDALPEPGPARSGRPAGSGDHGAREVGGINGNPGGEGEEGDLSRQARPSGD